MFALTLTKVSHSPLFETMLSKDSVQDISVHECPFLDVECMDWSLGIHLFVHRSSCRS